MRNRSHSKPGHRASQRPKPRGRNRAGNTLLKQGKLIAIGISLIEWVDTTHIDVTFSGPVIGDATGTPAVTDLVCVAGGGTTRHATVIVNTSDTLKRCTLDGALTAAKTYTATLAANAGSLVPSNGVWGTRVKTFDSPA